MSSSKYFQDELTYLREAGSEFAQYHPKLTQFLSEGTFDPDVERLLEGFAFLTGRIREKIDDELPELTQSLMTLLWPHYMRSVPSMCVTELTPHVGGLSEKTVVKRGAEMASEQVEGTQCLFQTCYDVDLYPISIAELSRVIRAQVRQSMYRYRRSMVSIFHVSASIRCACIFMANYILPVPFFMALPLLGLR
ncbi:protein ImpG/VasA [Vibrio maritimus]|uniref:Protein ImpG/VasA n=1 Tax=Vibrio maritimus TaxID=990268 RepID=A0A090S315_9VIBR|nr:protein ImpG/VasA [Vibrio maritimus]